MAEVERIYTIPLREAYEQRRSKRAIRAVDFLKRFLARHMKTDVENVRISKGLNELVWARGIQKPPRRVKALVKKDASGKVLASLVDEKKEERKKEERPAKVEAKPEAKTETMGEKKEVMDEAAGAAEQKK